jgi:predicted ATPase
LPSRLEQARCWELPGLACPHVVGRQTDLATLRQHLREGQSLTLTGLPGVGKTALALTLAHEYEIQQLFEGVLWARLGPTPDLVSHCARWGKLLGLSDR